MINSQPKPDAGSVTNLKMILLLILCTANLSLSFRLIPPFPPSQNEVEDVGNPHEDYYKTRAPNDNPDYLSTTDWNSGSNDQGYHQMGSNEETYQFTRELLNNIAKRTAYAHSREEIREQEEQEEEVGMSLMHKRNPVPESHWGGCRAIKYWREFEGYYPRHIKTYNCTTNNCSNFGSCSPKLYVIKLLQKNIPVSAGECDVQLPEELRCEWKLVPLNVTTYCQCVSGSPSYFG
ncbi:unnamed protein product [Orchesella dallaii]|uniref:Protein giant-lens n=1 Tax=Orchesella dallaii TaxID=48710 RepID=A0ABP1RZ81_9HEXA